MPSLFVAKSAIIIFVFLLCEATKVCLFIYISKLACALLINSHGTTLFLEASSRICFGSPLIEELIRECQSLFAFPSNSTKMLKFSSLFQNLLASQSQ